MCKRFVSKPALDGETDGGDILISRLQHAIKIKYAERYSAIYSNENKNISDTQGMMDLTARLSTALLSLSSIFPGGHK